MVTAKGEGAVSRSRVSGLRLVHLIGAALIALGALFGFWPQQTRALWEKHLSAAGRVTPANQSWVRLEGCELVPNRWNDGDSFHVRHRGQEYLFRLYFVDTPESETSLPERLATQAAYFGVSPADVTALGKQAAAFSKAELGKRPFTVLTHWRDALGRSKQQRFYAIVLIDGRDLNEALVSRGLARIYGTRVPLPDGRDSRAYLTSLKQLETRAKREKRGGWGLPPGS